LISIPAQTQLRCESFLRHKVLYSNGFGQLQFLRHEDHVVENSRQVPGPVCRHFTCFPLWLMGPGKWAVGANGVRRTLPVAGHSRVV
jgi:hypothetical protein